MTMNDEPAEAIYLDHHATTPVDEAVLDEMVPFFTEQYGNPASDDHIFGSRAKRGVEQARERISNVINARKEEIIFTSGATESDNLAIRGAAEYAKANGHGDHIITTVTEHDAVLEVCTSLQEDGFDVTFLPVDRKGLIDLGELEDAIRDETVLISVMAANNEIGTIAPIKEIGEIAKQNGVLFHTDAVQALGYISLDVEEIGIDLMSISGHKVYGPKGIGGLYVRRRNPKVKLKPLLYGGGHERGWRSGTLNVPGIVGLGKAVQLADQNSDQRWDHTGELRELLWELLTDSLDGLVLNGHPEKRIPNNLNISFIGVENKALVRTLQPEIAVSAGSACTTGEVEASHVLQAITDDEKVWHSSIRFGFGIQNTEDQIAHVADRIIDSVNRLRKIKV